MKFVTDPDGRLAIQCKTAEELARWSSQAVEVSVLADGAIITLLATKSQKEVSDLLSNVGFVNVTGMVLLKSGGGGKIEKILVISRSAKAEYAKGDGFISISLPCGEVWVGIPNSQRWEELCKELHLQSGGFSWAALDVPFKQADLLSRIADHYCILPESQALIREMVVETISEMHEKGFK